MRFKANAITAENNGFNVLLKFQIPITYGKQIESVIQGFTPQNEYELKPYKQKRSLSANALAWVYCDKLAEKLHSTKEEIYRIAVANVGVFTEIKVADAEAAKRFRQIWQHNGVGWLTKTINETTIQAYYGSSTYNTQEMARLIDFLQDECRLQGIETRPQEEIDSMLREWGESSGR